MDKQRAALAFVVLGLLSIAGAAIFLLFAQSLGGFSYLGAIASIFLAMLSAAKFAALRRPAPAAIRAAPAVPSQRASLHKPAAPRRLTKAEQEEDAREAELEARLAALRAAAAQPMRSEADPEHAGAFASTMLQPEPDPEPVAVSVFQQLQPGLEVIEEPLEPAVAHAFVELRTEPADPLRSTQGPGPLRQMDELRAEIARMREDARLRHGGGGARVRPPNPAEPQQAGAATQAAGRDNPDPFARTEFSGLRDGAPAGEGSAYSRTEFSGLEPAREGASPFARTAYMGPVELGRNGD